MKSGRELIWNILFFLSRKAKEEDERVWGQARCAWDCLYYDELYIKK